MIWLETQSRFLVNGRGRSMLAIIWCPWSQHQNWNLNPHNSTWDLGVSSISANPLSVCFNKIYLFALKTRVTEREREDERPSGKQWREIDLSAISLPPLPHPDSWLQWPILSQTIAKSFIGFPLWLAGTQYLVICCYFFQPIGETRLKVEYRGHEYPAIGDEGFTVHDWTQQCQPQ